jgi:hypothetical protein
VRDPLEAERFVEGDARGVRQRDDAVGALEALPFERREQRPVERRPGALASPVAVDVHRQFDRPPVGVPVPPPPRVGVADRAAVPFGDDPGEPRQRPGHAVGHRRGVRRRLLEGDGRLHDRGAVDIGDGSRVGGLRHPESQVGHIPRRRRGAKSMTESGPTL